MKRIYTILLIFLSFSFCGCEYKELCYEHPHTMSVKVEFDWQKTDIAIPRWMEVWLFQADGSNVFHFQVFDYENGYIHIAPGHYRALCYSGDTECIREEQVDDFHSFLLTAGEEQPERIVCASLESADVLLTDREQVILFTPEDCVMDVTVTIRHVRNLQSAKGLYGMLSGMSSGLFITESRCTDDGVTLRSDMEKTDSTTLRTRFVCFGHCPKENMEHVFSISAAKEDGTVYTRHWDVAGRMHDKWQDPWHIEIELDSLSLPEYVGTDGGMSTFVDGWQDQWIEI